MTCLSREEIVVAACRVLGRTVDGPTVLESLGPCWDRPLANPRHYPHVMAGGRLYQASNIVLAYSLGRWLQPGHYALHRCDRRCCVRPSHLYEGTRTDNMRDRNERTGHPSRVRAVALKIGESRRRSERCRGTAHGNAKLNDEAVKVFRVLAAKGVTLTRLAAAYGVRVGTVSVIVSGKSWAHVEVPACS